MHLEHRDIIVRAQLVPTCTCILRSKLNVELVFSEGGKPENLEKTISTHDT
jgi:hypothetical protein